MGLLRIHTSVRKKSKTKTKAQLEAEASFVKFKAKWDAVPKFAHSAPVKKTSKRPPLSLEDVVARIAEQQQMTVGKLDSGSTAPRTSQQYTGTKMLGVGTMHKSNSVPVFSEQEALDIATMRRG